MRMRLGGNTGSSLPGYSYQAHESICRGTRIFPAGYPFLVRYRLIFRYPKNGYVGYTWAVIFINFSLSAILRPFYRINQTDFGGAGSTGVPDFIAGDFGLPVLAWQEHSYFP